MHEYTKLCIFIILYFQIVASYKIYQLDSAERTIVLPKIRQLLLNQRHYTGLDSENFNVRHAKRELARLKPMGKSVLVKRKIPHGYSTGVYEYDSKLNTVFKPLARYHVKKPIEDHELSVLKELDSDQLKKDKNLIVLVQKDDTQPEFLKQIQNYVNKNARPQKRKKKGRFRGLLNRLTDDLAALREKSGEDNDPFAPGKLPPELQPPEPSGGESMEKIVYPIYPFYNTWTYHNTIIQDQCPSGLIKVGNMCISSIGHRRSAHPSNNRRSSTHKKQHSIRASRKKHLYGERK